MLGQKLLKKLAFLFLSLIFVDTNAQITTNDFDKIDLLDKFIPGTKEFFTRNHFDFHIGSLVSNYQYDGIDKKGHFYTVGTGFGWRCHLYSNEFFSIAPRIASYYGFNQSKLSKSYNANDLQIPLTLHISLGAGSSKKAEFAGYKYGFDLGFGGALNRYSISQDIRGVSYSKLKTYLAPIIYCCFKYTVDDFRWGIQPSYSFLKEDYTLGILLYFDLVGY